MKFTGVVPDEDAKSAFPVANQRCSGCAKVFVNLSNHRKCSTRLMSDVRSAEMHLSVQFIAGQIGASEGAFNCAAIMAKYNSTGQQSKFIILLPILRTLLSAVIG